MAPMEPDEVEMVSVADLRERRRAFWSRALGIAVGVYLAGLGLGATAYVILDEIVNDL